MAALRCGVFRGGLINQGLPSTLGGDTYRAVQSARHQRIGEGPALRYGTLCVVLDRGIGLLSNVMLGTLGLILGGLYLTPWAPSAGWALGLAIVSALLLVGALFRTAMVQALLLKLLKLLRLPHGEPAIRSVFAWPGNIGQILTGLSIHLLTLGCFAACLKAYGATVPFEAIMIGMPALTLLMMLPISISGWGLRETTLSAVLLLWDVPASTTVLASISYGLIVALCYLPAAWFLVRNRPPSVTSVTNPSH
nr:lysylphosphatidylglycerol synthase transmembrane domain-containing protein [Orrella marina]